MKSIRRITALLTALLMLSAVLPALAQTASGDGHHHEWRAYRLL